MGWWSRLFSKTPEAATRQEPAIEGRARLDAAPARAVHDDSPALRDAAALAESADAGADVLRQWLAEWAMNPPAPGDRLRLVVAAIEAPSVRLAVDLELAARGVEHDCELIVEHLPEGDDPRVPCADVDHLLWAYDGTRAVPALPPPDPSIAALVAGLASQPFEPQDNWVQARQVAARLGDAAIVHLLAAMVHPSPLPAGMRALAWLPRTQTAAAMVIAQIDDAWDGSPRRAALRSMLLGPGDWTTGVAIDVLARIARDEPAHAQDIERLFRQRAQHVADGHWDWIAQLHQQWATLPCLTPTERARIVAMRAPGA